MMYAELRFGDEQWAVTFSVNTTPAYRASQFAFEARRAAERDNEKHSTEYAIGRSRPREVGNHCQLTE